MMKETAIFLFSVFLLNILGCATKSEIDLVPESGAGEIREYIEKFGIETSNTSSWPKLYFNGEEIKDGMLELIEMAEDYILLNTFLISYDEYSAPVMEALARKQGEGVDIYVLSDSSSRFMEGESGFSYFNRTDIQYTEYNAIRPWKLFPPLNMVKLFYRDHRKYWVVDGKYVFLGGGNIIGSSLKSIESGGNTDAMVLIESPDVAAALLESFVTNWNNFSKNEIHTDSFHIPASGAEDTMVVLFNQESMDESSIMEFMINRISALVEKEVWIIQPYTFVNELILSYLRGMQDRGVEVNVVLSEEANHQKFYYASYYGIKDLMDAGVQVWIYSYKKSPLHYKAYVVDDRYFSIGSSNFNKRSLELSAEANLLFTDEKSFNILSKSIEEIKKHIRKVSPEEAERYRGPKYKMWHLMMQNAG